MYISSSSRTPLLPPEAYYTTGQWHREAGALFQSAWHLVGSWSQLSRPGEFLTTTLLDTPVQVRNFEGQLQALSNVCAHRHCLLTSQKSGRTDTMRCQYHGWEYGADGRTRKIPCAKEFVPLDREVHCLPTYRVARCGQLVFVSLAPHGPDLTDQLGDFAEVCERRFGDEWHESLAWEPRYPVNWKIPIENSLEAYHVPSVHPETFRDYPGSARSKHLLLPNRTAFGTTLPFCAHSWMDHWFQQGEAWLMRCMGVPPTGEYWQHHLFPNLLFSFTDAISLCHGVIPTGPRSCFAVVRQFGRSPQTRTPVRRWLARAWGRMSAAITKRILKEDMRLFTDVQQGVESSPHVGLLGICEERIYAFQEFIARHCGPGADEVQADRMTGRTPTSLYEQESPT